MNDKEKFKGYKTNVIKKLKKFKVRVWSDITIKTNQGVFEGVILPRSETSPDGYVVLKLVTGYNIGIDIENIIEMKETGFKEAHYKIPESEFPVDENKPYVTLLGTGGTIASRLDYRTGAVIPAFSPGELYGAVPELADIANLKTIKLFGVFSENMGPEQWIGTANAIREEVKNGVDGIVIGHGTDTMHHTAGILSFMVQDSPVPIIMVGSQRSSDRPSSDAAFNLRSAVYAAAHGDIAEVMVCMFGPTSEKYNLLHRGTRVRKMHSSTRNTFRTIGDVPVAMVTPEKLTHIHKDIKLRRKDKKIKIDTLYNDKVAMVYYYPDMKPDIIESLIDNNYKGIVIAGTGLGHVNKPLYEPLKLARKKGIVVFMTVQTLWGFTQMYVYDTGRDLMDYGVVPVENMIPEVAYVKLGWVLGHTSDRDKVIEMMLTPIAGEITEREPENGYLIFQGGTPEISKFLKNNLR